MRFFGWIDDIWPSKRILETQGILWHQDEVVRCDVSWVMKVGSQEQSWQSRGWARKWVDPWMLVSSAKIELFDCCNFLFFAMYSTFPHNSSPWKKRNSCRRIPRVRTPWKKNSWFSSGMDTFGHHSPRVERCAVVFFRNRNEIFKGFITKNNCLLWISFNRLVISKTWKIVIIILEVYNL